MRKAADCRPRLTDRQQRHWRTVLGINGDPWRSPRSTMCVILTRSLILIQVACAPDGKARDLTDSVHILDLLERWSAAVFNGIQGGEETS